MRTKIDVRRAIIERGYKIPAFAEKCGMTPVNLRENIIKGNPTVRKLSEICEVLNCDITDLFYPVEENDMPDVTTSVISDPPSEPEAHWGKISETEKTEIVTTTFCPHCGAKVTSGRGAPARTIGKIHGKLSAYRGNIIIWEMFKNLFYGVIVA